MNGHRSLGSRIVAATALGGIMACSDVAPPRPAAPSEPATAAPAGTPASPSAAAAPPDECARVGDGHCTGAFRVATCTSTAEGKKYVETTCAPGSGCVRGACVVGQCSDECTIGDVAGGKTCALRNVDGTPASLEPRLSTHDKARDYSRWLRRDAMPFGGVASPVYADPGTYADLSWENGVGDSSMVTGNYLASEAWRYQATGSPIARANAIATLDTLDLWLSVTGEPGNLARFVRPTGAVFKSPLGKPVALPDLTCKPDEAWQHCNVDFGGTKYDYIGHVSRDEYTGVLQGLLAAYDHIPDLDEPHREKIRRHVVTLAKELAKHRTVSAVITLDLPSFGVTTPGMSAEIETQLELDWVVLIPREMDEGRIHVNLVGPQGTGDGKLLGLQEWIPDLGKALQGKLPAWTADLVSKLAPRSSVALMVASIFRGALHVTEGAPAWAADRAELADYYAAHAGEWMQTAARWVYTKNCGGDYYGANIMMHALYDLARLETDPALAPTVHDTLLHGAIWETFRTHKNAWFDVLMAGASKAPMPGAVADAAYQLTHFRPAPAELLPVHLAGQYPADPACPNNALVALDVDVRPQGDLMWQREPWTIETPGRPGETDPGIAYLEAYWLARRIGALDDDAAGRCAAW